MGANLWPLDQGDLSIYYKKPDDTTVYVDYTKVNAATYTFVMPDVDVRVYGQFVFTYYTITPKTIPEIPAVEYTFHRNGNGLSHLIGQGQFPFNSDEWVKLEGRDVWTAKAGDKAIIDFDVIGGFHYAPMTIKLIDSSEVRLSLRR